MTEIQIANMALTMLGADTITAFTDSTEPARALSAIYDYTRDDMLREYPWSWAIKRAELEVVNDTILDNGGMETWTNGAALAPDDWTLSGTNATIARSSAHYKYGSYSAAMTRVGNDCTLYQDASDDKGIAYWQGRTVTMGAWVLATVADVACIFVYDGVDATYSTYHTGSGDWEYLEVTHTVNAAATDMLATFGIKDTNTTAYIDDATMLEGSTIPVALEPEYDYTYQHYLPSDCLRVLAISNGSISLTEYRVEGDRVLSDYDEIYIRYVAEVADDALTDSNFCHAFATRLAAELAFKITSSATLAQNLTEMAIMKLSKAKAANAQEANVIDTLGSDDWIDGRQI